ncbi:MAG: class I tRNA ligase family protein, partial [Gemmatimonadota bacterium]|nr:class I tRNA ligase family protein [Gemmatimonadota bacterium]
TTDQRAAVDAYRERTAKQDLVSRKVTDKSKTGVFTGTNATNPATSLPIPIWIADYVLMEYGTGAIMAVPAHDERDFAFAMSYGLPIKRVVAGDGEGFETPVDSAYSGDGRLVNSGTFDGLPAEEGARAITAWLISQNSAKSVVNYRLHDWCISRQRYWGPPIPIIYCDSCGLQAVPVKDLPVLLPHIEDFRPDDSGVSPLARHKEWYLVPCPECGKTARRETDVSDTFLDSAWYFLRYTSTGRDDVPFDSELTRRWLPVDFYIGGNEHAVLHLLYTRFITMVLHDMGHVGFEEPFKRFRAHGHIVRDGAKMSKNKGNVVNPDAYIEQWGADAFRMYLMFLGPFEEGGDFREGGISGVKRFLDRLWKTASEAESTGEPDRDVMRKLHQTIKKVGEDTPALGYNTAIAAMMEYMNVLRAGERASHRAEVEPLLILVAPYAPHIAEELWERFGHSESVFETRWPEYDQTLAVEQMVELVVQVNGKVRGRLIVSPGISQEEAVRLARSDPGVAKFVIGEPTKAVFVPGRLLNLVV